MEDHSQSTPDPADERNSRLNQEPGTAAPQPHGGTAPSQSPDSKAREERGNEGPEEMPGFGQGA